MRSKSKYIVPAIFFVFFSQVIYAQEFGRLGAPFLRISPHARQVGMGEAFTAMANSQNILSYNVGGLGLLKNASLSVNYHNWIDDTGQGNVEAALPLPRGVLGLGLTFFDEGKIEGLDEDFNSTANGSSGSSDLMLAAGYGVFVEFGSQKLAFGIGGKFIRQDLAGFSSSSFGLDVGAMFTLKSLSFGATLKNLTIKTATFDQQSAQLPEALRTGVALKLPLGKQRQFNIATDVAKLRNDSKLRIYSGVELRLSDLLAVRGGYKFHNTEAARWGFGLGLSFPTSWFANSTANIDYAYAPLDDFNKEIHRFSFTFTFGVVKPPEPINVIAREDFKRLQQDLANELQAAKDARKQAEEAAKLAQFQAEEARKKAKLFEEEMARRLARIKQIAESSEGKIEVRSDEKDSSRIKVALRHINFDFDKSDIRPNEVETLSKLAQILNTYPESKLWIQGHSDSIGTEIYNIHLSNRRMQSVMAHLAEKGEISQQRYFLPIAYGESKPVADNGTEAGRARNRRVEFTIFTRGTKPGIPDGSGVTSVRALTDTTYIIEGNGRVKFKKLEFKSPPRIVFDFPGFYNLSSAESFHFDKGPVLQARIAYHFKKGFTRVVFDLVEESDYETEIVANTVVIKILTKGKQYTRKVK